MWIEAEYTDTFGGEANYAWVRRTRFRASDSVTDRALVARVKREFGLTGVPCRREVWGETIVLRPRGMNTVVFIETGLGLSGLY